jgi:hypothetical protein
MLLFLPLISLKNKHRKKIEGEGKHGEFRFIIGRFDWKMHGKLPCVYWKPGGIKESTSSTKFQPAEMIQHPQSHQAYVC